MSILIVDDTPDNILLFREILRKDGQTDLMTANSAQAAYEILGMGNLKNQKAQNVELILMDIMMPEISGIDACEKIKEMDRFSDVPVIMLTARTEMESLESAFSAGAMDYITKPVKKVELIARVRSALKLYREIETRKHRENELKIKNQELEKAVQEIKTLQGFIPICCVCKKIRDVSGYWQQLEAYFQKHTDVKFSHGLCEVCLHKSYMEAGMKREDENSL